MKIVGGNCLVAPTLVAGLVRRIGYSYTLTQNKQWIFQICGSIATDWLKLLFTQYKNMWLIAISSNCLAALPAKMFAFNSHTRKTPTILTWSEHLNIFLLCYCYTIKTNSRTICLQVWQLAPAGKGADMSELQAHHCMTPEQWTRVRFMCSVSVTPANKLSLQ